MNKDQHNSLLYKLISIDRDYTRGNRDRAQTNTLRVIMRLISDNYELNERVKKLEQIKTDKNSM